MLIDESRYYEEDDIEETVLKFFIFALTPALSQREREYIIMAYLPLPWERGGTDSSLISLSLWERGGVRGSRNQ